MALKVTKKNDIYLSNNPYSILYEMDTYRYIKSPEEPVENRIQIKVKKTFIRKDDFGYLFSVKVIDRKQSNKDDVLGVEDQLANLQNKLTLYTDEHGDIISIVNRGEISEKWYEQKKFFKKEHKHHIENINQFIEGVDAIIKNHDEFLNLVKKSEINTLLFPPIYQHNLLVEDAIKQQKVWHDFFDTTALPVKLDTKVVAINEDTLGYQIIRSGDIDTPGFDEEKASQLLSTLYDVHKYNIKIDGSYLEALDLSEDDSVEEATSLMNIEIPGVYSYRQISKLKAL